MTFYKICLLYPCVLPYRITLQKVRHVLQKSTYKVVLNSYDKCQKLHFSLMQVWYLSCDFVSSLSLRKLHLEQHHDDMLFFSMVHISLSMLISVLLEYQIKMCKLLHINVWIFSLRVVFLPRFVFVLRKRLSIDSSRFS